MQYVALIRNTHTQQKVLLVGIAPPFAKAHELMDIVVDDIMRLELGVLMWVGNVQQHVCGSIFSVIGDKNSQLLLGGVMGVGTNKGCLLDDAVKYVCGVQFFLLKL